MDAGQVRRGPVTRMWMPSPPPAFAKKREPKQPIVYAPMAKNAT